MGYISEKGLANLKDYKYHGVDHSIFAKILQYWWTWAINLVPVWIAPNLITLIGTFFLFSSFLIQYYYCPYVEGEAPRWTYFFHFFALFIYQTMDALDGKQARRTKTSSPLGELFDHGCDAISVSFIGLAVSSTLQIGANWVLFILMMCNFVAFYFAQWEEYHTGTLELGYFNVTEAQLLLMGIHFITFLFGPGFWLNTVTINVQTEILGFHINNPTLQYNTILMGIQGVGAFLTLLNSVVKMQIACLQGKVNAVSLYSHLIPVILAVSLSGLWAHLSPKHILQNNPTAFLLGLGFLFAFLVGRIVLARVCKDTFSWFQPLVLPLAFACVNAYMKEAFVDETILVKAYCALTIASYLHFAMSVINALCAHLKIRCLSIPVQKID